MKRVLVGMGAVAVAAAGVLVPWNDPALSFSPPAHAMPVAAAAGAEPIRDLISPWCSGVPVTLRPGHGGQAGYTSSHHPVFGQGEAQEYIEVGEDLAVGHPSTAAVALHECAHILQYRAYDYDAAELESAMERVYPGGTASGVEHMADCISEALGAERTGRDPQGVGYSVGYGGACDAAQLEASQRILAGQRL